MNRYEDLKELKFVEYCRKSSETDERQILSLGSQTTENRENAARFGIAIQKTISEAASAKYPRKREGFLQLIKLIQKKEFDAIIVWNADRLSRNSIDSGELIYLMDLGLLKSVVTNYRVYFNNPEDKKQLQDQMTNAKYDNDRKSDDVKRGIKTKIAKGQWSGPAKPGYINVSNRVTGENYIDVDPERFELIKKAFELILYKSYTPMEAMNELNEWGYVSKQKRKVGGRPMNRSTWYRMLGDTYYYGLIRLNNGLENTGTHKPMITEYEYDKLQMLLGRKNRPLTRKHNFPYKKYLKCGACSGSVTAHKKEQIICSSCKTKFALAIGRTSCTNCGMLIEKMKNPKILTYVYYSCINNKDSKCKEGSLRLKTLEDTVLEELGNLEVSDDFFIWALDYINELDDKNETNEEQRKKYIKEKIVKVDEDLSELLKLKLQDKTGELITVEEYKTKRNDLKNNKLELLKVLNEPLDDNGKADKDTFEFAKYSQHWFKNGDDNEKETIVDKFSLNLKMTSRKLYIDKKKAYFLIEKANMREKGIRSEIEPMINAGIKTEKELHEALIPVWLGDRDSNPNFWDQNPACCHYTIPQ